MSAFDRMLDGIGRPISARLQAPASGYEPFTPSAPETLHLTLQPADVLLVEGNQKVATAIKYLTQSTWSHAVIHVGGAGGAFTPDAKADLASCIAAQGAGYASFRSSRAHFSMHDLLWRSFCSASLPCFLW